jgi:proteic killer suppression protein
MRFKFQSKKLQLLYTEEKNARKYPASVVDNFFEIMAIIEAVSSEQDLYQFKGLRYEKLQGQRGQQGQHSLRLDRQWRLIITLEKDADGKFILVIDIEDYH